MLDPVFSINQILLEHLAALTRGGAAGLSRQAGRVEPYFEITAAPGATKSLSTPVEVVVSLNEVNDKHGTGPLIKRIFAGRKNIFSIRSKNDWNFQDFGDWHVCVPQQGRSRAECFRNILSVLGGRKVRSVLCVPYLADEILSALAVKECFEAPLCAWIMDDQNVARNNISDELMGEFLEKCALRLVTHPELRHVYEGKYGLKFHLLPAIVPQRLVGGRNSVPQEYTQCRRGALLGSIWDQSWFDRLCEVLARCDCHIDWFGNNRSPWVKFPAEALARGGITAHGLMPEEMLAEELRRYPFVIVPAAALDGSDNDPGVANLSLPGRILFALATSRTPVLVIGSEKTCGARFVRHFRIGEVAPYDAAHVRGAIDRLLDPAVQTEMRQNAAPLATVFSDEGIGEWLANSILRGAPEDPRFERAFADYPAELDLGVSSTSRVWRATTTQ